MRTGKLSSKRPRARLKKKAKRGFRGYPMATIACYGPDDKRASKLVVAVIEVEDAEPDPLRKWYSDRTDVRNDPRIGEEVVEFLEAHGVLSLVMPERIIGCPHEEVIDYPEGEACPQCLFWKNRDRFTGQMLH